MKAIESQNKKSRRGFLSNEFKVACVIYEITQDRKNIAWFTNLSELLSDYMSASTLLRHLKFLESWGIAKVQYGETGNKKAGRLYYISNEDRDTIAMLYEKYCK